MAYSCITYDCHEHTALVTLNRPDKLNALSAPLRGEMRAAVAEAIADDNVRAIVFTGAGRGFCSGADLTGPVEDAPPPGQNDQLDEFGWVGAQAKTIYQCDKPVIAAVNGVAAGAGLSLATACDVRVGTENSRFKSVFIERNLSPDSGLSFFLPRIVGYSRAADLIFSSRFVYAEEALSIGLLDRVVPTDDLVAEAVKLGDQMGQWPPLALRMSKRVLQHNMNCDLDEALRFEYNGLRFAGKAVNDAKESRLAFLEKRAPTYTGT